MFIETLKFLPSEIWHNPDSKPWLIALAALTIALITSITVRKTAR